MSLIVVWNFSESSFLFTSSSWARSWHSSCKTDKEHKPHPTVLSTACARLPLTACYGKTWLHLKVYSFLDLLYFMGNARNKTYVPVESCLGNLLTQREHTPLTQTPVRLWIIKVSPRCLPRRWSTTHNMGITFTSLLWRCNSRQRLSSLLLARLALL